MLGNDKHRDPLRRDGRAVAAAKTGVVAAVATVLFTLAGHGGCQNRDGMACQEQADCNAGLSCNKPPGAGPTGYGACEPGKKGVSEICVSSAECDTGLICSTDVGQPFDDGWHGMCQVGAAVDMAGRDAAVAVDAGVGSDASSDL